jgi:Putative adhesin
MPTFDTPRPISVTMELGVAHLEIVASDRADTVVEVEPSDPAKSGDLSAAAKTTVEYADGELRIKAPKGWRRYNFRGGVESVDVRIQLPAGSHLRGEVGLADLRCSGALGECRYKTGMGNITIEEIFGDTDLTTGSGAISVDRIGGSATVKNSNGDTRIGEVVRDLQVKAANGKITVDHAHAAVTAKTANGDIRLDEVVRDDVVAKTGCGKVDIAVRCGVPAWLDLHTSFGHVQNLMQASDRPGTSEQSVQVHACSSCGDITIRRAGVASGQGAA